MPPEKKEIKFEQPSDALIKANRFVWLIIMVIILLVWVSGYFFVLAPGINDIKSQRTATEESDFVKAKHGELLKRLQELKSEYENIKTTRKDILDKLKAAIPAKPETAELFIFADKLARDRGFNLEGLELVESKDNKISATNAQGQPTAAVPQGLPAAISSKIGGASTITSSASLALATSTLPLNSLIIHLSLIKNVPAEGEGKESAAPPVPAEETSSPYDSFKAYLADLENNLRLMDIQSVAFGEFSPEKPITFNVNLVTYYK